MEWKINRATSFFDISKSVVSTKGELWGWRLYARSPWQITLNKHGATLNAIHRVQKRVSSRPMTVCSAPGHFECRKLTLSAFEWSRPLLFTVNRTPCVKTRQYERARGSLLPREKLRVSNHVSSNKRDFSSMFRFTPHLHPTFAKFSRSVGQTRWSTGRGVEDGRLGAPLLDN